MERKVSDRAVAPKKAKKRYRCTWEGCNKDFGKNYNLKTHLRMHTGERPFQCLYPNCGKSFMWRSSWISHLAAHRGLPDLRAIPGAEGAVSQEHQVQVPPEVGRQQPLNPAAAAALVEQLRQDGQNLQPLYMDILNNALQWHHQNQKKQENVVAGPSSNQETWQKQIAETLARFPKDQQRGGLPAHLNPQAALEARQQALRQELPMNNGKRPPEPDNVVNSSLGNELDAAFNLVNSARRQEVTMGGTTNNTTDVHGQRPNGVESQEYNMDAIDAMLPDGLKKEEPISSVHQMETAEKDHPRRDWMDFQAIHDEKDNVDLQDRIRSLELNLDPLEVEDDDGKERQDRQMVKSSGVKKELRFANPVRRNGSARPPQDRQMMVSPMLVSAVPSPFNASATFGANFGWPASTPNGNAFSPGRSLMGTLMSPAYINSPGVLPSPTMMSPTTRNNNQISSFFTPLESP